MEKGSRFWHGLFFFGQKIPRRGFSGKQMGFAIFTMRIMKRLSTAVMFVFDRDELLKAEGERYA